MIVVDVGNTRTRIALAEAGGLRPLAEPLLNRDLALADLPTPGRDSVRISAVGAPSELIARWSEEVVGSTPELLRSPRRGDGLTNAYAAQPAALGVDRWLAMIAARSVHPGDLVVADAGTALTVDLLPADGRHRGGYIVPGLAMARAALDRGTATLPEITEQAVSTDPGLDTETAIGNGTLRQQLALVASALDQLAGATLVLTGGDASLLHRALPEAQRATVDLRPELVLEGLACCDPTGWEMA